MYATAIESLNALIPASDSLLARQLVATVSEVARAAWHTVVSADCGAATFGEALPCFERSSRYLL